MLDERIAVLEEKVDTLEKQNEKVLAKLDEITSQLSRQKGFIGGAIFIISALGAALGFIFDFIKH